jgi:transaldolase/glucose-6-phosphate isomerase
VGRIHLTEKADLGQEFFRWEVAVAAAGAVLGIHPFNQPDVELAKDLAERAMVKYAGGRALPEASGLSIVDPALAPHLQEWLKRARPGDYVALQAYLAPTAEATAGLQAVRTLLRDRLHVATTVAYGPRFLHSTGQLHKGGPNTGLFLQLVADSGEDLPVPETDYTFGALIRAQSLGDYEALQLRGRRVLRVHLRHDVIGGLERLAAALSR